MEKKRKIADKFKDVLSSRSVFGAILPLIIIYVVVYFVNPNFFRVNNLLDVLRTASFTFIVAMPLTFLMSAGASTDLSISATTSLGGVVCALFLKAGFNLVIALPAGVCAGVLVGLANSFLVVRCKLPDFIATLGTQYAVNGFIAIITNNLPVANFDGFFKEISQYKVGNYISMPVIYATVIGVIGHIVMTRTRFGRECLATGGNKEAAHLAGINVKRNTVLCYVTLAAFSALSGILIAARFASAQPAAGNGTEMTITASVIIGGTSMFGGQGTIIGSALGCILLATITNALIVMHVSTLWQNLIYGLILIIALFVDKARRKVLSGQ